MYPEYPQFFEVEVLGWELERQNQQQEWTSENLTTGTKVLHFLHGLNKRAEDWLFRYGEESLRTIDHRRRSRIIGGAIAVIMTTSVQVATAMENHPSEATFNMCATGTQCALQAGLDVPQPSAGDRTYPTRQKKPAAHKTNATEPGLNDLPPPPTIAPESAPPVIPPQTPYRAVQTMPILKGHGLDISSPQCDPTVNTKMKDGIPTNVDFVILGLNDTQTFTKNPCLEDEIRHFAGKNIAVYINTANTSTPNPYKEGYEAGKQDVEIAKKAGLKPKVWWLDVETANTWSTNAAANRASVQGEIDAIRTLGAQFVKQEVTAGIYGHDSEWGAVMGKTPEDQEAIKKAGWPDMPAWIAGGYHDEPLPWARRYCNADPKHPNFLGGTNTQLVQLWNTDPDQDFSC